jgi:hypothetical protein
LKLTDKAKVAVKAASHQRKLKTFVAIADKLGCGVDV